MCEGVFSERISELFIITPNPVKEKVNLKFTRDFQKGEVIVYDIQGRAIFTTSLQVENGNSQLILPKNIKNGIYFLRIMEESKTQTSQFILYR